MKTHALFETTRIVASIEGDLYEKRVDRIFPACVQFMGLIRRVCSQ